MFMSLLSEPVEIEAGDGESVTSKTGFVTVTVETKNRAGGCHGDVAVGAPFGFDGSSCGPRLTLVLADADRHIASVATLAWFLLAIGAGKVVWVAEEEKAFAIVLITHQSGHADGLDESVVKLGFRPISGPIGTGHYNAAMRLRLIAHVQHDATVAEFDSDGFIGIDELVRAGHRDLTRKPRLAAVITVDRRGDTGTMRVASRSGGKPAPPNRSLS